MIESSGTTFRSPEQVLCELAKALHFGPEALEINRKGRLAAEQIKRLAVRCVEPAFVVMLFLFVPLIVWVAVTAAQQQISFTAAVPIFFKELLHLSQSSEAHGNFGAALRLGSVLLCFGIALFGLSRFPFALYLDLLDGTLCIREGRVVAREEQTIRPNGRDPIEKYFFDIKTDRYEVNLAAFRAVEDGGVYLLYVLPRSQELISVEPRVSGK